MNDLEIDDLVDDDISIHATAMATALAMMLVERGLFTSDDFLARVDKAEKELVEHTKSRLRELIAEDGGSDAAV